MGRLCKKGIEKKGKDLKYECKKCNRLSESEKQLCKPKKLKEKE